MKLADYINKGYRVYKLEDLNLSVLYNNLYTLQRQYRLDVEITDDLVLVKDTNKYDSPRNPYISGK